MAQSAMQTSRHVHIDGNLHMKDCRCCVQASVVGLDAHTEFAILKANFSGATCCRGACSIVLQHGAHQGETSATMLVSAAMQHILLPDVSITSVCYIMCELFPVLIIESGIIACHIMLHVHLLQAQRSQAMANTAFLLLARANQMPTFLSE